MINCQISITVHRTHAFIFGMHEQSIDAKENTSNVCTRHNINRICQTRKIHQSATHLYSHRSISRHQFIAFAFIVDQTETSCACVHCVTYWQYCRCLFLRCVRISLLSVCARCLIPLFYSTTTTATPSSSFNALFMTTTHPVALTLIINLYVKWMYTKWE